MRVLIAIPHTGLVAPVCFQSVYSITVPEGTTVDIEYMSSYGCALVRNKLAVRAVDGGYTHILYIDSDQIVPADLLVQLAKHDADMVAGWALMRVGDKMTNISVFDRAAKHYKFLTEDSVEGLGVIGVDAVGFAAALIKTSVLHEMQYPYFVYVEYQNRTVLSEDLHFCSRLKSMGKTVLCDTTMKLGHLKAITI